MNNNDKPSPKKVFVASSHEGIALMEEIAGWLEEFGLKPLPWTQEFQAGHFTLEQLIGLSRKVDAAVFIFTPDDEVTCRGATILQPRDNVVLEFGLFAGALGLQRAIICNDGNARAPGDLDGLTHISVENRMDGKGRLRKWAADLGNALHPNEGAIGILKVHRNFPNSKFIDLTETSKTIRILQSFIPTETYLPTLVNGFKKVVEREDGSVKILICHHRSAACYQRQLSLAPATLDVARTVRNNFSLLSDVFRQLPVEIQPRMKVKAYMTLPSVAMYQADEAVFLGNYFHGTLAVNGPQLEIHAQASPLGKQLLSEFEKIWNSPSTVLVDLENTESWLQH